MDKCGFSDLEYKIIRIQIERRAKYRQEFLRLRTDPCLHSLESGHVFDRGLQNFLSMKTCQVDHFKTTPKTALQGFLMVCMPMIVYGYALWKQRSTFSENCRCGRIRYRDRRHKLN